VGGSHQAADVGLHYLATAARLRRAVDGTMAAAGASLARTKILQVVVGRGPVTQAQLAAELGLAARSVGQAVEAMEREGVVRRSSAVGDRRAKVVTTTEEGVRALAAGEVAGEEFLRRIFQRLGPDRIAALDEVLAVIDEATAEAAPPG
jgi:DNA-binding MarR family transcriptional regulator